MFTNITADDLSEVSLSTQIILKEALARDITVEKNTLKKKCYRLSDHHTIQYYFGSAWLRANSYESYLLQENKLLTRIVFTENGISMPEFKVYSSPLSAGKDYSVFSAKSIVIKPVSTNCGKGITVLLAGFSGDEYQAAINFAFSFSKTILIDTFFQGDDYRFLVVEERVIGVIKRIPANITGDGVSTVEELVAIKNTDKRRGDSYKYSLRKLTLGETEKAYLRQQGLTTATIPEKGKLIFIRGNSNMSTGGDTYDFTDIVHPDYLSIACKAAMAVKARITGVDLLIRDSSSPASKDNHVVLECNMNPCLSIHNYPYEGKNRNIGKYFLDLIGF